MKGAQLQHVKSSSVPIIPTYTSSIAMLSSKRTLEHVMSNRILIGAQQILLSKVEDLNDIDSLLYTQGVAHRESVLTNKQ